jgi:hypothetical protein
MLAEDLLSEADFFLTDDVIIKKINDTKYKHLLENITPETKFEISEEKTRFCINRKLRFVDPMVLPENKKLTDLCPDRKAALALYLNRPKEVFYKIPLLDNY